MDRTKAIVIVIGIAILGYAAHDLATISDQQEDLSETADQQNLAMCEDIRQQACLQGEVTQEDYPDSCFEDSQHILDDPYTCPE